MLELLAAVAVGVGVAALVAALIRPRADILAVEQRLSILSRPVTGDTQLEGGGLLRKGSSRIPAVRYMLARGTWSDRALVDLQQAGLRLKVSEYFLIRLLTGFLGFIFALLILSPSGLMGMGVIAVFAIIAYMLPAWYVGFRKTRRRNTLNTQLVETIDLISNSLRSGFAFIQSVELAARQVDSPMSDELHAFLRDTGLGAKPEDALRALSQRTGSLDVDMLVTTIHIQRTTGGNLSETLGNVAETIRERERLQREIRSLTASQRLTGTILGIYPIVLAVIFAAIAPDHMSALWNESAGRVLLVIAGGLQLMGIFTIRQILKLDV